MASIAEIRTQYPQYDELTDKQLADALYSKFYEGKVEKPDFYDKVGLLDKKSGAPASIRMAVGGAPEQDRLAQIQKFYPDASPYGDDNFIFTDPRSGKPTVYNPKGFDLAGDTASVAREAVQAVGGTLGAAAGAVTGLVGGPAAPVTIPGGAVMGAAVGTAAADSLFDIARSIMGRVDTRSPVERITDVGVAGVTGGVGQKVGELLDQGVKAVVGIGKSGGAKMLQTMKDAGITNPPAGAVTNSRFLQSAEQSLADIPSSANVMQKSRDQVIADVKTAAQDLARGYGEIRTKQGAGEVIRGASKAAIDRFEERQDKLYETAFDLVGADSRVTLDASKKLLASLEGELAKAPKSLANKLGPAVNELKGLIADAGDQGLEFSALRQLRTSIGMNLKRGGLQETAAQNTAMKLVYGALTDDMSAAAKLGGKEAESALQLADRYTRAQMAKNIPLLKKVIELDADEKAFQYATGLSKEGGTRLAQLRNNFQPQEWDSVAATVLNRLGQAKPGAQDAAGDVFSVDTFLTNWASMAPEARKVMFGGTRYADLAQPLDRLVKVTSALKESGRLANTSGTARALAYQGVLGALGGSVGLAAGGDLQSAGMGVAGTVVTPYVAARLLTNPRVVNWIVSLGKTEANSIVPQLTRLAAIAKAEPEIKDEIRQFISAFRPTE